MIKAVQEQLAAFREGAGPDMGIMVDLNFNYKTEGFLKMARAMEPFDLTWVEIDTRDPKALHYIRSHAPMPVASLESLFGRRDYRPFFENYSVDVAIIDTPWNGVGESVKIANMADAFEMNVAPHNFYGPLATMMSAHFCAVVPNLRIMETDPDVVPWHDDLVTVKPDYQGRLPHLAHRPRLGHGDQRGHGSRPPAAPAVRRRAALVLAAVLVAVLLPGRAPAADRPAAAAPSAAAGRAAEVIATLADYRAKLEALLPLYEQELARAIEQREQRRELLERGIVSRKEFEATETVVAKAQQKLEDTRRAIAEVDHAMVEATTARAVAALAPLGRGGYEQIRDLDPLQRPHRVVAQGGRRQARAILPDPLRAAPAGERLRPDAAPRPDGTRSPGRARRRGASGQPGGPGADGASPRSRHPLHRRVGCGSGLDVGRAYPRGAAVAAHRDQAVTRRPRMVASRPAKVLRCLHFPSRCRERTPA